MAKGADTFATLLRRHRLALGLSQELLAERAGLSARGISALERGVSRAPRRTTVDLLVRALALSPRQARLFVAACARAAGVNDRNSRGDVAHRGAAAESGPVSSVIGREREIAAVRAFLGARGGPRLVTLTGPAGVGKSCLAQAVVGGVRPHAATTAHVVELASLADPDLVPGAVSEALVLRLAAGQSPLDALVAHLDGRCVVLVLDNCEHLLDACRRLADALLRRCSRLRILATSRVVLGVQGEHVWPLPPLSIPPPMSVDALADPERLLQYAAVRLFVDRARAAEPGFAVTPESIARIAEICRRLDGLPLAIELAAARVRVLTVAQIASLLDDRFRLLTGGSPATHPRHQALRAALDWSYRLLNVQERALFRRLAVFAGGCTLASVATVGADAQDASMERLDGVGRADTPGPAPTRSTIPASDVLDLLARLVDASLVQVDASADKARYTLLESIRLYGAERLRESGEEAAIRGCHLAWVLSLVEVRSEAREEADRQRWRACVVAERDNLRAALAWSLTRDVRAGLRLVLSLTEPAALMVSLSESSHWLDRLAVGLPESDPLRATALCEAGAHYRMQGRLDEARRRLAASEALVGEQTDPTGLARVRTQWALLATAEGDATTARDLFDRNVAFYRAIGDTRALRGELRNVGLFATGQRDYAAAWAALTESLALARATADEAAAGGTLYRLGIVARLRGEYGRARVLLEEGLALVQRADQRVHMAGARCALGDLEAAVGNVTGARAHYDAVLRLARTRSGEPGFHVAFGEYLGAQLAVCGHGTLAVHEGNREWGARLLGAALVEGQSVLAAHFPHVLADVETALDLARDTIGTAAVEAAWQKGQAMGLEEAVAAHVCVHPRAHSEAKAPLA
jgi:predicted ATPase/transcriptional regulator with XRE-family HTH domain